MGSDAPYVLPLADNELPEVTDAGVGLTVLMLAIVMADRERRALHRRIADAIDGRDWADVAALHRRLGAVPCTASRMASIARDRIGRYDAGQGATADCAATHARVRRGLVRLGNWFDTRFWTIYATARGHAPAAVETAPATAPGATGAVRTDSRGTKPCRKAMRSRLTLLDDELVRLCADLRPAAGTARLIMIADRNSHAARCRACAACRLATAGLTRDIPVH